MTQHIMIILTCIYKVPFLTGACSALQLLTTFTMTKYKSATDSSSQANITCSSHTHTHTHVHTHRPISSWWKVSFKRLWFKGRGWLTESHFFQNCVPECWGKVRENVLRKAIRRTKQTPKKYKQIKAEIKQSKMKQKQHGKTQRVITMSV